MSDQTNETPQEPTALPHKADEKELQDLQERSELFRQSVAEGQLQPPAEGVPAEKEPSDITARCAPPQDTPVPIPNTNRVAVALAGDIVGEKPIDWEAVRQRLKERDLEISDKTMLLVPGIKVRPGEAKPDWVGVANQFQGPIVFLLQKEEQDQAQQEVVLEDVLESDPALYEAAIANKKHPQFILAMDASFFEADEFFPRGILRYPMARLIPRIQSHLVIRERGMLEKEENYRQLLPYMVVTTTNEQGEKLYWSYQRTPKVGEERLINKASIGFGGHIDIESVIFSQINAIDLDATIRYSNLREKDEELKEVDSALSEEGAKLDRVSFEALQAKYGNRLIVSDEGVDKVHLGIIMELDVPSWMRLTCNEEALIMAERAKTASQLLFDHRSGLIDLESWSHKYLMDVFTEEAAKKADALEQQQ